MHQAKFRVGLIQMACSQDPAENLAKAEWRIREAAGKGAQILRIALSRPVCRNLHVKPSHLDRAQGRLACLDILEQRPDFGCRGPESEYPAAGGGDSIVRRSHPGLGQSDIVQAGFPDQHVETEALVKEFGDARLGREGRTCSVTRFSELHYAG